MNDQVPILCRFPPWRKTEFRIVSMYLVAQYFRQKNGKEPDWSMSGLQIIYDKISKLNTSFSHRLREATSTDASVNAIIVLDCFANAVPFAVRTALRDYEHFEPYWRQETPADHE